MGSADIRGVCTSSSPQTSKEHSEEIRDGAGVEIKSPFVVQP